MENTEIFIFVIILLFAVFMGMALGASLNNYGREATEQKYKELEDKYELLQRDYEYAVEKIRLQDKLEHFSTDLCNGYGN